MNGIQSWGDTLRLLVEFSATAAFALSGLMEASRKKLIGHISMSIACKI
jgi:hypothetical protein